jgi:hypothetical protein
VIRARSTDYIAVARHGDAAEGGRMKKTLTVVAGLCAWSMPWLAAAQTATGLPATDVAGLNAGLLQA